MLQIAHAVKSSEDALGPIDCLIPNAGIASGGIYQPGRRTGSCEYTQKLGISMSAKKDFARNAMPTQFVQWSVSVAKPREQHGWNQQLISALLAVMILVSNDTKTCCFQGFSLTSP